MFNFLKGIFQNATNIFRFRELISDPLFFKLFIRTLPILNWFKRDTNIVILVILLPNIYILTKNMFRMLSKSESVRNQEWYFYQNHHTSMEKLFYQNATKLKKSTKMDSKQEWLFDSHKGQSINYIETPPL